MDNTILIILGIILLCLIILNHITMIPTPRVTVRANCGQTTFGCCPDGVNSKINFYGTNCPSYKPGPGYYPTQYVQDLTPYGEDPSQCTDSILHT